MKRKMRMFVAIAVASLGFSGGTVPNFKLPNLQNKQVQLSELLNDGPVVLDFWATWCLPCLKAFPELEKLHKKYQKQGLTVVGINADGPRNQAKIKPFVRTQRISFPILVDGNNEVMRLLQVQALPTTILIARDGTIVTRRVGFTPEGMQTLEQEIVKLLATKTDADGK